MNLIIPRRHLLKASLAAPFVRTARASIGIVPRFYKPSGTPVAVDWSQSFTSGLLGLWDLSQTSPTDIAGRIGTLTAFVAGVSISNQIGGGRQNNTSGYNNGVWITNSSSVFIPLNAASILNIGVAQSGAILSTWLASLSGSTTGNYFGVDLNTASLALPAPFNPHLLSTNNNLLLAGSTTVSAGQQYHTITTLLMDGSGSSFLSQYVNGVSDGTPLATVADTFAGFDTFSVGCQVLPDITGAVGSFTNGSPTFVCTTSFSTHAANMQFYGLSGIPAGTYLTRTNFGSPNKNYTMSAAYTGTTGSGLSFNLTGTEGTGTCQQNIVGLWNRALSSAEAAALAANYTGWIIYPSDLHRFGTDRDIMKWLRHNDEQKEKRFV